MSTLKQIQEVISRNLPEATALEMKKFIEEAEETKDSLELLEEKLSASLVVNKDQQEFINILQRDLDSHENLRILLEAQEVQEEVLRVKEQSLDYLILEVKLECAEQRNKELFSLVEKVFGHPSVTVSKNSSVPVPVSGGGEYAGYVHTQDVNEVTTTTEGKV